MSTIPVRSLTRPRVLGIHHLKFAVSNLDVSIAWYERVLGARRIAALDHVRAADGIRFAVVLELPDWARGLYVELRLASPLLACKDRGWDPVTLTVCGKDDIEAWAAWLDNCGTLHSPPLVGLRGWILVFEDPDGRRIRLYTKQTHDGREATSKNVYWLSELA